MKTALRPAPAVWGRRRAPCLEVRSPAEQASWLVGEHRPALLQSQNKFSLQIVLTKLWNLTKKFNVCNLQYGTIQPYYKYLEKTSTIVSESQSAGLTAPGLPWEGGILKLH